MRTAASSCGSRIFRPIAESACRCLRASVAGFPRLLLILLFLLLDLRTCVRNDPDFSSADLEGTAMLDENSWKRNSWIEETRKSGSRQRVRPRRPWAVSRRICCGFACGPRPPWHRANRERCDNERRAGLSRDPRESGPASVPEGCVRLRECRR